MDKFELSKENSQAKCIVCGSSRLRHFSKYKTINVTEGMFIGRRLVRCQSCNHIQIDPMLIESELNEYYCSEQYWSEKLSDERTNKLESKAFSQIAYLDTKIPLKDVLKVLDIGAGYGRFFQELKQLFPQREFKFTAVEGGTDAVEHMKKNFEVKVFKSYHTVKGKFDLIVISHFMEHMSNPAELMQIITKLLSATGACFIEVPNKDYIYRKSLIPHISFFSTESLSHCCTVNGLKLVDIRTVGVPIILLNRNNAPHIRLIRKATRFYEKILQGRLPQQYNEMFLNTDEKKQKMIERSTAIAGYNRYRMQAIITL